MREKSTIFKFLAIILFRIILNFLEIIANENEVIWDFHFTEEQKNSADY